MAYQAANALGKERSSTRPASRDRRLRATSTSSTTPRPLWLKRDQDLVTPDYNNFRLDLLTLVWAQKPLENVSTRIFQEPGGEPELAGCVGNYYKNPTPGARTQRPSASTSALTSRLRRLSRPHQTFGSPRLSISGQGSVVAGRSARSGPGAQ